MLLKLVEISRGRLVNPDMRSSVDNSTNGYSRLSMARRNSSGLNISNSQRTLKINGNAESERIAFHDIFRKE